MENEIQYLNKLMPEQKKFVENVSHNSLVSASAGTGKTTTMISKLTYLIVEKNMSVCDFLVVTYTNAAANEMRHKLYKKLLEVIDQIDDEEKLKHVYLELEKINNADIGTLHSICNKWIKKYFYVLGMDTSFALVVDKEQEFLLDQALDNILDNISQGADDSLFNIYESFNGNRKTESLKQVIKNIYIFLCSKCNPDNWKSLVLSNLKEFNENIFLNYLSQYIKLGVEKLYEQGKVFLISSPDILKKYEDFIKNRLVFLNAILKTNSFFDIIKECNEVVFLNKPTITKSSSMEEKVFDEDIKPWRDSIKQLWSNVIEKYNISVESFNQQSKQLYDYTSLLFCLCENMKREYTKLKNDRHYLDFNDLEQCTIQLLKNVEIKEEIKNKYKYVFVDEYQDINEVQEFIISSISKVDNLNLIGDVKQSIYAFRLSKPQNFIDKINIYSQNNNDNKLFYFNYNFRSEDNILQFVNTIFDKIIIPDSIGIDYINTSRLIAGMGSNHIQSVKLDLIDTLNEDENLETTNATKEEWLISEAKLVANEIIDLIENKTFLVDGKPNKYRYKDIAVLTRNRGQQIFSLYKELSKYNIPVSSSFKSEIFQTFEVQLIINYLKLINNCKNEIELVGVLKSLYGFSADDLAKIKLIDITQSFMDNFYNNSFSEDISSKIKLFLDDISEFRMNLQYSSIYELTNKIILKFDLINYFKSFPDGVEKESNIYEFLTLTMNDNYSFDLPKFLNYIKSLEENEYVINTKSTENCVRIMTMHSSKGLGIPAVIVAGLNTQFNINKGANEVVLNEMFGVGLQFKNNQKRNVISTLQYQVCKLANSIDEKNEEIRLLYVALTRAEHNLIMIGSYKFSNLDKIERRPLGDCKSMLELILFSFDKFDIHRIKTQKEFFLYERLPSICEVNSFKISEINGLESSQSNIVLDGGNLELSERLSKLYSFKYGYENCQKVAFKNSVSSLLHEEIDYENSVSRLESFVPKIQNSDDAMELGSIYHRIMQELDYSGQNTEQIIAKLISEKEINEDKIKGISLNLIDKAQEILKGFIGKRSIKKECKFMIKMPINQIIKSEVNEKVLIQGIIDLVVEDDDSFDIVDFKTNRNLSEKDFSNLYGLQLQIYALAYEKYSHKKLKNKYIYSFENKALYCIN